MKTKSIYIFLVIFLLSISILHTQTSLLININEDKKVTISPYLFGGFIEYYFCFMNSQHGLWAQEFYNRGFDIKLDGLSSPGWERWYLKNINELKWETLPGGYNENGLYYEKLINNSKSGEIGIGQYIYTTKYSGFDFYIYAKSDNNPVNLKLKVLNVENKNIIFDLTLGKTTNEWKKYKAKIPEIKNLNQVFILIYIDEPGNVALDESSIMASNNIDGVNKELYDLYKRLGQTVMRYPGGWFVEYSGYHWEMGIGDIDKRRIYLGKEDVRLDFGIDEYIKFCRNIKAEPHITINYLTGSPSESASILSYTNSDTNTYYGSLRKRNGNTDPYKIKYWEIGNEIWFEPLKYAIDYNKIYDTLKKVDPSIKCIISGDVWHGKQFFDTIISTVVDRCDIWGYHWTQSYFTRDLPDNKTVYLSVVGGSYQTDKIIDAVDKWGESYNKKIVQGITELWSNYNPDAYDWVFDTTYRAGSLENALWMATQMNSVIRRADVIEICEKSNSMALIRKNINNKTNERFFYTTPVYDMLEMLIHHHGDTLVSTQLKNFETYSTNEYPNLTKVDNLPWIDASCTKSKDTIFLNIVNRNPDKEILVNFNLLDNFIGCEYNSYELFSNNYLVANTPTSFNNFKVNKSSRNWDNSFIFKPSSYTILAIPRHIDDANIYIANVFPTILNFESNILNIKLLDNSLIKKIEIFDINLRNIYKVEDILTNFRQIDLHEISIGFYLVLITDSNDKKILSKFIKV